MIGRIATFIILLVINYAIQIYGSLFLTGSLDEESISEKIGVVCFALSYFFPIVITFVILKELIQGGLL